jgi:hypothetical protein
MSHKLAFLNKASQAYKNYDQIKSSQAIVNRDNPEIVRDTNITLLNKETDYNEELSQKLLEYFNNTEYVNEIINRLDQHDPNSSKLIVLEFENIFKPMLDPIKGRIVNLDKLTEKLILKYNSIRSRSGYKAIETPEESAKRLSKRYGRDYDEPLTFIQSYFDIDANGKYKLIQSDRTELRKFLFPSISTILGTSVRSDNSLALEISKALMDKFVDLDEYDGLVTSEDGLTRKELIEAILPSKNMLTKNLVRMLEFLNNEIKVFTVVKNYPELYEINKFPIRILTDPLYSGKTLPRETIFNILKENLSLFVLNEAFRINEEKLETENKSLYDVFEGDAGFKVQKGMRAIVAKKAMNERKESVAESMRKHMQAVTELKKFVEDPDNFFLGDNVYFASSFWTPQFKSDLVDTYNIFLENYSTIKYFKEYFYFTEYDDKGVQLLDAEGKPKYAYETDKDGKTVKDKDGNPVYAKKKSYVTINEGKIGARGTYKYAIGKLDKDKDKDTKTLDKSVGRMIEDYKNRPVVEIIERIFNSQNGMNKVDLEIRYAFMTFLRREILLLDEWFKFKTGLKVARRVETVGPDGKVKIEQTEGFGLGQYGNEEEYDYEESNKKKDPFGEKRHMMSNKMYLNKDALDKNNLLEFRYYKNNHLSNIRPQIVTNEFKDIIKGHISGTGIDHDMINKLSTQEKHFLRTLDNRFKMNMKLKDDDEDGMNSEYNILIGQYKAGNDSTEIKLKLRKYIDYYVSIGRMSKYEASKLIHLLNI